MKQRFKSTAVKLTVLGTLFILFFSAGAAAMIAEQTERTLVGPGVELLTIRQFSNAGWLNIFALEVDRVNAAVRIDGILGNDTVTERETVRAIAQRTGASAAVNGDFFYINASGAPLGPHIQGGKPVKTASGNRIAFGIPADSTESPFIGYFPMAITARTDDGPSFAVAGLNDPNLPPGTIGMYDEHWGSRANGPQGPDLAGVIDLVYVVIDESNTVQQIIHKPDEGPRIAAGMRVLAGRGSGGERLLANAKVGHKLHIDITVQPAGTWQVAVGGGPELLRNGAVMPGLATDVHPRTAVGYSEDGQTVWLVVVDGRSPRSRGVSLPELAAIMKQLGAHNALNLDGGGSTTLVAATPGSGGVAVRNVPSDGGERTVPNGLGVYISASPGQPNRVVLVPPAALDGYRLTAESVVVPPGGHHEISYAVVDAAGNETAADAGVVQWSVEPGDLGEFISPGVMRALRPGQGYITAAVGNNVSRIPLRVTGEPIALHMTPYELALHPGQLVPLTVTSVDSDGFRAPLHPMDIVWDVRGEIGTMDGMVFRASDESASGAIVADFNGIMGSALVGIGGEPELISDFETPGTWRATVYPAEVRAGLTFTANTDHVRNGQRAVQLDYDFTTTSKTRAAYVNPSPAYIELPGRPLKIGVWVYGDGNGAWLRGQIVDRFGVMTPIDFEPNVDWTGWKYTEATIPDGIEYPISLRSVYVVETRTTTQYTGRVFFDDIVAVYAPDTDPGILPVVAPGRQPQNRPYAAENLDLTNNDQYQFIVFGDSKVQAGGAGARGAQLLEASINAINGHDVPFVLYTGDLVENDSEPNYVFAKSYMDRLNAPYHFAVANHEIAGTNSFARFRRFFGDTYGAFTHENALFITLNAARPGLLVSEAEQWPWLLEQLDTTTAKHVFINMHIPVIDPQPGGTTGWSDSGEVGLFEKVLADTAARGKNVYVFNGHVHGFNHRASDGVHYITTAGAGSSLYMSPHRGGFYHYTLVTVNGDDVWYEVIPLLSAIVIDDDVPVLNAGDEYTVTATGVAPLNAVRFPLAYPAQVRWSVSDSNVLTVDAATGRLTALAPGTAVVTVESAGITAQTEVTVR